MFALSAVSSRALDRLRGGITIDGVRYGPIEATLDREQGANVWLTVGIREGKNREVRKVLETLKLKVNRLIRVAFGPFELGELDDGAVREIETEKLRESSEQTSQRHSDFQRNRGTRRRQNSRKGPTASAATRPPTQAGRENGSHPKALGKRDATPTVPAVRARQTRPK